MPKHATHARLLTLPSLESPAGGRLDALHEAPHGKRTDLLMNYHELQLSSPPTLFDCQGQPCEHVQGTYIPRCLRFIGAHIVHGMALCTYLEDLPPDHSTRTLTGTLHWRSPEGQNYHLFGVAVEAHPSLLLTAQRCVPEKRLGPPQPISLTRKWSPPPASPARLVPNPHRIHQRYGGDPITIRLHGRAHQRRLFIGGVDLQREERPDVQVVLNVGEVASRWTATTPLHPADRWDNKGEGSEGMNISEIAEEARWVIERLQAGQRVLVHCVAGMNRSATICCAALILLEGVSAETALERVREQHPWARPDSHHWLALRWLAHTVAECDAS